MLPFISGCSKSIVVASPLVKSELLESPFSAEDAWVTEGLSFTFGGDG